MFFSMFLEYIPPNIRDFDVNDKSINFPFTKHEIISALMLPVSQYIFNSFIIILVI